MRTKDDLKRSIGDMLHSLRIKHGYSKNHMAEIVGVDKHTWHSWESGATCPSIVDFIAVFNACDEPLTRPLLDMLHPDTYAGITDQSDIQQVRKAVSDFFLNNASDHMVRVCMYLFGGSHGSEIAGQIEQFCALDHLPIEYRFMIGEQIYMYYLMAEHRGELIETDAVMPNVDTWSAALKNCQKAAYGKLRSYSNK